MEWSKLFEQSNQPTLDDISKFVNNELWQELNSFLQNAYHVLPKLTYSKCSMQKGWNLKYQKSGKSLCVFYPMPGYFTALVVVGEKEKFEVELLLPLCSEYTKTLFKSTEYSAGAKWMMMNVMDKQVFEDVKNLIKIRVKAR